MFDQHVEAFKKAAVDDILMGENPLASYINDLPVELLPCQIPFLNQVQCHKWLEKEIKKDYIKIGWQVSLGEKYSHFIIGFFLYSEILFVLKWQYAFKYVIY